jgi:hypothetical protein
MPQELQLVVHASFLRSLALLTLLFSLKGAGCGVMATPVEGCQLTNQLCKFDPKCAESHGHIELRYFLVTGAGSSGTSWVRSSLKLKGFDVADESWGVRVDNDDDDNGGKNLTTTEEYQTRMVPLNQIQVDASRGKQGMVSWAARCWTSETQRAFLEEQADEGHGHALFEVGTHVRFRLVVHLVRHPLKAIRSNLFFSQSLRRCHPLRANSGDGSARSGGGCGGGSGSGGNGWPGSGDENDDDKEYCEVDWWRLSIWEYVSSFTANLSGVALGAVPLASLILNQDHHHQQQQPLHQHPLHEAPRAYGLSTEGFAAARAAAAAAAVSTANLAPHHHRVAYSFSSSFSSHELAAALDARLGPLALSALHWFSWNALLEPIADLTVSCRRSRSCERLGVKFLKWQQ